MTRDKATLPFGDETLLGRVVRILGEVVSPVVVVAARDQCLPELAESVTVVRDRLEDRGPLEGLAAGLEALRGQVDLALATACDAPLLKGSFAQRVIDLADGYDVAVPRVDNFYQSLSAVYRVDVLPTVNRLLEQGLRRPQDLFSHVATREILRSELIDIDPDLVSLRNVNTLEQYRDALEIAGCPIPTDIHAWLADDR